MDRREYHWVDEYAAAAFAGHDRGLHRSGSTFYPFVVLDRYH